MSGRVICPPPATAMPRWSSSGNPLARLVWSHLVWKAWPEPLRPTTIRRAPPNCSARASWLRETYDRPRTPQEQADAARTAAAARSTLDAPAYAAAADTRRRVRPARFRLRRADWASAEKPISVSMSRTSCSNTVPSTTSDAVTESA